MQGAAAILDVIGSLLSGNKSDIEARNRATAAAAAAEEQRQAELARQQALAAQKRQEMFDRLSRSLKLSGLAKLCMKGFDNNPGPRLKGLDDTPSDSGGELHLKGIGDSAAATETSLQPNGTAFFGRGGGAGTKPSGPELTGDPNAVDLPNLQQGVDLAVVAANGPAGGSAARPRSGP